jgi:hypothetical protein
MNKLLKKNRGSGFAQNQAGWGHFIKLKSFMKKE